MRGKQTNMEVQLIFMEFKGNYRGGGQSDVGRSDSFLEIAQVFIEVPHLLWTPCPSKVVFRFFLSLIHPIQGKSVEEGGVLIVMANTNEFAFPVFVGLLEDGKDGPPSNPTEANP